MPASLQVSVNFPALHPLHSYNAFRPFTAEQRACTFTIPFSINCYARSRTVVQSLHGGRFKDEYLREGLPFLRVGRGKNGFLAGRGRRFVMVKFNNGFNGLGGGGGAGGGGGRVNSETARVLGNLGLAILLTYLSMTGQLGWLLDAIVSLWLLAILLPILGIGAFLWWAGRDILQSSCPNCGNEFQVFKSTLNDELQLCPFCSQPFSVEGDEFVSDPVKFSNESSMFDQAFGNFTPIKKKGKDSSPSVVDIEAEIRDAD